MRALIVEDEALAARRLRRLAADDLGLQLEDIAVASSLDEARAYLEKEPVDLLFLDLDLAGRDGFDALRGERPPPTIIVSANVERAIEAFDHAVVDFVAKPISAERLSRAIAKAREASSDEMRLVVRAAGRATVLPVGLIVRISGADDYVEIVAADGATYLHDAKLETLARQLPQAFVRVHRSHIVNMAHVREVRGGSGDRKVLVMSNEDIAPLSRRRARDVQKALTR